MLPILILFSSFWLSDALMNDIAVAAKNQMLAENAIPPYLNNIGYLNNRAAGNTQNAVDCPNTTILLYILNILTKTLSSGDKINLEPEKLKYILTTTKTFLETLPMNPENIDMYNKFKELEVQLDNIRSPKEKRDLHHITGKPQVENLLKFDIPAQSFTNCRDVLNGLVNFFNKAYPQLLKYCLATEKCFKNNANKFPNVNNGMYPFNPNELILRNFTPNVWPAHETLTKESVTAGADLANFIRNQEGMGVNNIMSILQNYRPNGVSNIPASELKNPIPNGVHNPLLDVNPGSVQLPNLPINEMYGKSTQPQNPLYPNIKTEAWLPMLYKIKGLPGAMNENNQLAKILTEQFYKGNNLIISNPKYNEVYNPSYMVNAPTNPFVIGPSNGDLNKMLKPSLDQNPKSIQDFMNQNLNQQQNLQNSFMKISPTQQANPINKVQPSYDMNIVLNRPQNFLNPNTLPGLPQNIQYQKPVSPEPILNQYPSNQPILQTNNNFAQWAKHNGLNYNQMNFQNGLNMFPDNANQENNEQFSVNQLLSVANLGKLNAIPHKNGVVELTYVLKRPKPVFEPAYYVKYRMPFQTFLYNLQNMLAKKTNLRKYEPSDLYQDLLVGSNVTDASKDLKALNFEDILKLTSANGTLITAKILENNDTRVDNTLKIVQKLNSQLPAENIINYNINITKKIRLESEKTMNVSQNSSNINNHILNNVQPDVQRRGVYQNYPYNTLGHFPLRLQPNPYYNYQVKPNIAGTQFLKPAAPNVFMKYPYIVPSNIAKVYPQFGR